MGGRYVEVDRETFISALEAAGFTPDPETTVGELVYVRQHKVDTTMFIKIFTSLPRNGGDVRAKGQDAIRVLLMFKNPRSGKSGCLQKMGAVYRTGTEHGVIERTIQRARDAYAIANERIKASRNR